jgi:hypothetical protein
MRTEPRLADRPLPLHEGLRCAQTERDFSGIPDSSVCRSIYAETRASNSDVSRTSIQPVLTEAFLHERPRVAPRKGEPTFRVDHGDAFGFPYVEPNVTGQIHGLLVVDRDMPDSDTIAGELGLLPPSWVALNPHVRSGHIGYALKDPVTMTSFEYRRPANLLARIEHGLVDVLGGDPCYTGGLTKTPGHAAHTTAYGPLDAFYGLRELAGNLSDLGALPRAGNPRRNVQHSIVGRNVACFDLTRTWAYRTQARFRGGAYSTWEDAVLNYAQETNLGRIATSFTAGPMTYTEVGHIAHSIAKWVWANYTPEKQRSWGKRLAAKHGDAHMRNALTNLDRINTARGATVDERLAAIKAGY